MTERKPSNVNFETWVEQQIRAAMDSGKFDNLPGAGEPIRDLDRPYDEVWLDRKLRSDGHSIEDLLPTPLKLRKERERLPETVARLDNESAVRAAVDDLNRRIAAWLRAPLGDGGRVRLATVDVDEVVERWRAVRDTGQRTVDQARSAAPSRGESPTRRRWWRRRATR